MSSHKILIATLCLTASQAAAQLSCEMQESTCQESCTALTVTFAVDASQFSAPLDGGDPPRRQVTTVTMGDRRFTAQAIMMEGGIVGFHEDAVDLGSTLMIVQADGTARLSLQPENRLWVGVCTLT